MTVPEGAPNLHYNSGPYLASSCFIAEGAERGERGGEGEGIRQTDCNGHAYGMHYPLFRHSLPVPYRDPTGDTNGDRRVLYFLLKINKRIYYFLHSCIFTVLHLCVPPAVQSSVPS